MIHKTTRSILSVLLAALLLVTSAPLTPAFADGGTVSLQSKSGERGALTGSGAANDPYKIATADDLLEFADKVNSGKTDAWAVLTADIVLNEKIEVDENGTVTNQEDLSEWTPIGNEAHLYTGTFDGDGHTISGLYIDSSADYQGLFGCLDQGGTVKDLTVSGSVKGNISGNWVGGIVGYNFSGTVTNCAFSGNVTSSGWYVGGVVGSNSNGRVINCTNTGSVKGSGNRVGGVVGYNIGSVTNCYNTGAVSGGDHVGGVVGYNDEGREGRVENCYNTGTVNGSGNSVGGVVGHNSSSTVKNCYNTASVSGLDSVGGVVGWNSSSVTNCYNTGKVSGLDSGSYVGGVVGYNIISTVTGCYFLQTADVNSNLQGIGNQGSAEGAAAVNDLNNQDQFKGWDFADTWIINTTLKRPVLTSNHEDDGSKDHPYEIFTATQLKNFRDLVNGANDQTEDPDAHAKLMENIDLNPGITFNADGTYSSPAEVNPQEWTPIGTSSKPYTGTFNGDGHTISGLYINDRTADYQGLFGYVGTGGTVKDLTVSGSVSVSGPGSGSICVGGVVGMNNGTVTNCYNTGSVSGPDSVSGNSVGGVVGYNGSSSTVENCYNTGKVSGPNSVISNVGGVVGDNGGTVINCYNTGNVSVKSSDISNVGGVVGYNDSSSTVTNCYNTGNVSVTSSDISSVSGDWYVGGVVGYNNGGSVTGCYFLQQNGVPAQGIGSGSGTSSNVEARTADAFHSGEVAYLLQNGQKAAEGGVVPLVWGQSKLGETTSLPTLNPTDEQKVYQVTFDYGDSFTETDDRYDYHYANANDNVTLPTSTDQIPEYEGHTLTGWQNEDGQAVTEPITVTADITFTAQWTKDTVNYTVTVTTSPAEGGTVNGGGTFAEGTQVTVTATANDGYTFVAWQEAGTKIENAGTSYTFTVNGNRSLTAVFEKDEEPIPTPTPTPDPEPSGPSTGDSTGWDDIRDELENTAKGDQITIDMGDETKVPAEIFESLAGKDVDVTFDLGDIQWSVNGADIPTDTDFTDLDLGVNLDTHGIPVNVINTITGERDTVQMTLAHDGAFGFTMTLTAPLGVENAGYWANLYHYDEDADQLTFETAAEIDADGSVTIPFSHASQYAIVIDTHSHAAVDVSDLFLDIAPDAWYKDAVQYAYDHGLMTGVSANEFAPEQTTTRAMIVSILARLEGVTTAQAAGFADVDDEWYATAVNWAAGAGVVNGYEDNTFQPNTAITREQLAAILMNYAAYKGEDVSNRADLTSYTDQPSTWAQEAMQWAVAEGLISGVTNDQLQPQSSATRAQVAAILQRFLDK